MVISFQVVAALITRSIFQTELRTSVTSSFINKTWPHLCQYLAPPTCFIANPRWL